MHGRTAQNSATGASSGVSLRARSTRCAFFVPRDQTHAWSSLLQHRCCQVTRRGSRSSPGGVRAIKGGAYLASASCNSGEPGKSEAVCMSAPMPSSRIEMGSSFVSLSRAARPVASAFWHKANELRHRGARQSAGVRAPSARSSGDGRTAHGVRRSTAHEPATSRDRRRTMRQTSAPASMPPGTASDAKGAQKGMCSVRPRCGSQGRSSSFRCQDMFRDACAPFRPWKIRPLSPAIDDPRGASARPRLPGRSIQHHKLSGARRDLSSPSIIGSVQAHAASTSSPRMNSVWLPRITSMISRS